MPDKPSAHSVYRRLSNWLWDDEEEQKIVLEALRLKAVVEHPDCIGVNMGWWNGKMGSCDIKGLGRMTFAEAYAALYPDDERKRGE